MTLKRVLVQKLVFPLSNFQALLVRSIVIEFFKYFVTLVGSSNRLVFDSDTIEFTLIDQFDVLVVSNHSFSTQLKLVPGFLFNHSSISIVVLPLETNFLLLLSQLGISLLLVLLLLLDFLVSLNELLLSNLLLSGL